MEKNISKMTIQELFDIVNAKRLQEGKPYQEGPLIDDVWWYKIRINNQAKGFKNILIEEHGKQRGTISVR